MAVLWVCLRSFGLLSGRFAPAFLPDSTGFFSVSKKQW